MSVSDQEMQEIIQLIHTLDDEMLKVLWETITSNAGGIAGMDPRMLQAFYSEFQKRPGLLETMTETRKRNKMKLTKRQLQRIISNVIVESYAHTQQRPSLSLDQNQAIQDILKALEHELSKEFYSGDHTEAMERIREVIEQEYIKAHEESSYWANFNDRKIQ